MRVGQEIVLPTKVAPLAVQRKYGVLARPSIRQRLCDALH